jgi:hypothetical protein
MIENQFDRDAIDHWADLAIDVVGTAVEQFLYGEPDAG